MNPPIGSNITVSQKEGYPLITIPYKSSLMRYLIAAFLLFWLGGWFTGFTSASAQIMQGEANSFIIFWLGGWTIGGIFALLMLYQLVRPSIPLTLLLNVPHLTLDSGVPAFQLHVNQANQKNFWKQIFKKRSQIEISKEQMKSLKLRQTDSGNRLTLDIGTERLEIATDSTEIEREWLYDFLSSHYR